MSTTLPQSNLISITDAAERFGISRRTIERWIGSGELESTVSDADRRKRLVDATAVASLLQASSQRRKTSRHSSALRAPDSFDAFIDETNLPQFQRVIDNVLQLVYSHYHRVSVQLSPAAFQQLTLDQLRDGPLGHDLFRLAQLANGEFRYPREIVDETLESILMLLFWPVAADDYRVPRTFWDTDLGRLLARAKFRAYAARDLMSIRQAAEVLGLSRATVYQWIDERLIDTVRDDTSGRTFVVRRDVDKVLRFRRESERAPDDEDEE